MPNIISRLKIPILLCSNTNRLFKKKKQKKTTKKTLFNVGFYINCDLD